MEIAAVVSTVLSGVSTVVNYMSAQSQIKQLEDQATRARQEGEVQAQIDVNNAVNEQNALIAEKSATQFNQAVAADKRYKDLKESVAETRRKMGAGFLKLDSSQRKFGDVFASEEKIAFDKILSMDYAGAQKDYEFYKAAEEIDRKADYVYSQGMAQRDYTLAKFENQAITYENEAAATKSAATANAIAGIAGTAGSYFTLGSSDMIKSGTGFGSTFARKFYGVKPT